MLSPTSHSRNTPVLRKAAAHDPSSASVTAMTVRRRPRGAAVGAPALYARVDQEAFDAVDAVADRLDVSKAELVNEVLLHFAANLDERGVPAWWPKPVPESEELDLNAS